MSKQAQRKHIKYVRLKVILSVAIAGYFFLADGPFSLFWLQNAEYRRVLSASEDAAQKFTSKLRARSGEKEIAIVKLTDFEWDAVCPVGVYGAPRQLIQKQTGDDIPFLDHFNTDEYEHGLIFLKGNTVQAVLTFPMPLKFDARHFDYYPNLKCGEPKTAAIKPKL